MFIYYKMGKLSLYDVIKYTPTYRTFVESGTFKGDTMMELHIFFDNLYSIELNEDLYLKSRDRLKHLNNVSLLYGDSKLVLPDLCHTLPDKTIFYLDAHWSGDSTVDWNNSLWKGYNTNTSYAGNNPSAKNQVPLAEELKAIMTCYSGNAIILIDDMDVIGKKDLKFIGEDWSHLSLDMISQIIAPRAKSFNILKNVGIIELNPISDNYWSIERTYNKINIHGKDYITESNEFKIIEIPEYYPMIIRDNVSHLDRLSYILNKLSLTITFIGYEYGGYLIDNMNSKCYLYTSDLVHTNILRNVELTNGERNTAIAYFSHFVSKELDNDYLIIVTRQILELQNRKRYSLEDTTYFYVLSEYKDKFESKIKVLGSTIIDDNLMQLLIMVKNAGSSFYNMLIHNVPLFDSYVILDTGSTDNTIEIAKKVMALHPHGKLYQRDWKGFRESRNELLDIAGRDYTFNIMLDDTYHLRGNLRDFLSKVRTDDVANSFSIYIKDDFTSYISNRITKSRLGLRYKYRIHEVIEDNITLKIPDNIAYIEDISSEYMFDRTLARKREDLTLQLLDYKDNPYDTNVIYHIAESYLVLNEYENAFSMYLKCTTMEDIATKDQVQDSYYKMATLSLWNNVKGSLTWKDYCIKSYETMPERPEALYLIGYYYHSTGDTNEAYQWLKKAHQVNMGMTDKPKMNAKHRIYNYEIYNLLLPLCYEKNNYKLGLECCIRMENCEVKNYWLSVFYLLVEYYKREEKKISSHTTCFIAPGGWEQWDGQTLSEKGLGGTETAVVRFAETMAKDKRVVVLCNCKSDRLYNKVTYISIYKAPEFFSANDVETCYINRYTEYIPLCSKSGVRNIYMIYHDLLRDYERLLEVRSVKSVMLLSEWHREYFLSNLPENIKIPTSVISYGIEMPPLREKVKYSFIYPSFPNRGLLHLLDIFPRIRERYPLATLNVFCDLSHKWCEDNYPDMMRQIREKIVQDGVINHGWVSEKVLKEYWSTTHVWLYPCIFKETYCRVCLEAAANRVFMISNDLAALAENNKGIIISGDITEEWKDKAVEIVSDFFDNEDKYMSVIDRCYNWASEKTYDKVVKMLE